jgi:hypothetical protein
MNPYHSIGIRTFRAPLEWAQQPRGHKPREKETNMSRWVSSLTATLLLATAVAGAGHATDKGKSHAKHAKAATMKCPKCGMTMSTKKTAAMPVMVKMNGKTYYCCKACDMTKAGAPTKKAK